MIELLFVFFGYLVNDIRVLIFPFILAHVHLRVCGLGQNMLPHNIESTTIRARAANKLYVQIVQQHRYSV